MPKKKPPAFITTFDPSVGGRALIQAQLLCPICESFTKYAITLAKMASANDRYRFACPYCSYTDVIELIKNHA